MRWAAIAVVMAALSGCAGPVWLGAALGFGAAALNFDTELAKAYVEMRTPAPEAPK